MGKFIVLMIPDEADAQAVLSTPPRGAVPIGVFQIATQFCECPNLFIKDGLLVNNQFARGAKFGLYIHKVCKKPYRGHTHYPKNLMHDFGPRELPDLVVNIRQPYNPEKPFRAPGR
jgi:hypothetical protein